GRAAAARNGWQTGWNDGARSCWSCRGSYAAQLRSGASEWRAARRPASLPAGSRPRHVDCRTSRQVQEKEHGMPMDHVMDDRHTSPIRRLTERGQRWRVMVETWHDRDEFHGRFLFRQEAVEGAEASLESATLLHGRSREDVLALAHDLPEDQLRRLLLSLG